MDALANDHGRVLDQAVPRGGAGDLERADDVHARARQRGESPREARHADLEDDRSDPDRGLEAKAIPDPPALLRLLQAEETSSSSRSWSATAPRPQRSTRASPPRSTSPPGSRDSTEQVGTLARCGRSGDRGSNHVPRVRLRQGRDDADRRVPALLSLRGLPDAPQAAGGRLLCVLLVCGRRLPVEANRSLTRAELPAFGFEPGLLLRRDRGVEVPRDVPAEGSTQVAALADALGRAAAEPPGRVAEALEQAHLRSLGREGVSRTGYEMRTSVIR